MYTPDTVYPHDETELQYKRYKAAAAEFEDIFSKRAERFFSAPGRTEIGGNHTDHNLGCVLAAAVSLDMIAAVSSSDSGIIRLRSQGYDRTEEVSTFDTSPIEADKQTTASLIRGVADYFVKHGYKVGGFEAYVTSEVLQGSGMSSSAAFEVLVGTILNRLYNDGNISAEEIAIASQYAENVHFGKPSGLMDQMAASVGGSVMIDFADEMSPVVRRVPCDPGKAGLKLCIIDTKGSHADLTDEYAAIPLEMKSVAAYLGKNVLRQTDKASVMEYIDELRSACGDRAVLRALHFFDENERVLAQAAALENGDIKTFLRLVNESGMSSLAYLQNIFCAANVKQQGLTLGLYLASQLLEGTGACRVHGGGFAGTIQAFVPKDKLDVFKNGIEKVFGKDACHVVDIRGCGGVEVMI